MEPVTEAAAAKALLDAINAELYRNLTRMHHAREMSRKGTTEARLAAKDEWERYSAIVRQLDIASNAAREAFKLAR